MNPISDSVRVEVTGIVQGVGFRPFVYNLAIQLSLTGWVRNTSAGVEMELNGDRQNISQFLERLTNQLPPLARIDTIHTETIPPNGSVTFEILSSQPQPGQFLPISPDVSICLDCQQELFDPQNRRYHYPFINCTNCGPRYTIIRDIPYDRPNTTMAGFDLCPDCLSEYQDPRDRRFHAQPVACPVCGPYLTFVVNGEPIATHEEALQTARQWLRQGKILAIKGLGGYHLACDATNPPVVAELRRRKKRSDKPFALMCFDQQRLKKHAVCSREEWKLLTSPAYPIVLMSRDKKSPVAREAAPNQNTLGIMLPYTPLHLLLLEPEPDYPEILVMTSGNLSDEPIAYRDEDALERLSPLADGFLIHNRPIHMRVDDSVVRIIQSKPFPIRRSRGYAPDPIPLPVHIPSVLAVGAELKNVFCLTRDRYAFLSHHIGDMENYETFSSFEEGISHLKHLFRIHPERIACDLHPDYLATKYAIQQSRETNLPLIKIQHHHAHLASCLADNHWNSQEPVIGLSLDGTGMGTDGAIWGGEILLGSYRNFQRLFHLKYAPLAGGDISIRKPARMALAHLWASGLDWEPDLPPVQALCYEERLALRSSLEHQLNTIPTSSMGRLFDAAAALIGLRFESNYEGQAAIELEAVADLEENKSYAIEINHQEIDPAMLWNAIIRDWREGVAVPILAARFHNSIAHFLLECCNTIYRDHSIKTVALSGGVWQNQYLLEKTKSQLEQNGFRVLIHHQVPANDGGIALGQAVIAGSVELSVQL